MMRTPLKVSVSLTLALVVVPACAGTVSGNIDGESLPAFSTAAVADFELFNADYAYAYWQSAGDACRNQVELSKIASDADSSEEYAEEVEEYAKANLPAEYWYATLTVGGNDFDDLEEGVDIEVDDNEDPGASIVLCHVRDYPVEDDGALETDEECFAATDGTVRVTHAGGGGLSLATDSGDPLEMTETDGDDDFEDVTISGSANYCDELEEELEDRFDFLN